MVAVYQGVRVELLSEANGSLCVVRCGCQCSKGNEEESQ